MNHLIKTKKPKHLNSKSANFKRSKRKTQEHILHHILLLQPDLNAQIGDQRHHELSSTSTLKSAATPIRIGKPSKVAKVRLAIFERQCLIACSKIKICIELSDLIENAVIRLLRYFFPPHPVSYNFNRIVVEEV